MVIVPHETFTVSSDQSFTDWARYYGDRVNLGYPTGDMFAEMGKPVGEKKLPRIRKGATPATGVATITKASKMPHIPEAVELVEQFMVKIKVTHPVIWKVLRYRYVDRLAYRGISDAAQLTGKNEAQMLHEKGLSMFEGTCL